VTNPTSSLLSHIDLNIPPSQLKVPFYEGSVQRLFDIPDHPSLMVSQTTERGSVFDVGALFEIPGHDVNRAVFRHVLYSKMGDPAIWRDVQKSIQTDPNLDDAYRRELLTGPLEQFVVHGCQTHHVGMLDSVTGQLVTGGVPENPSAFNVVRKFKILKPARANVLGATLFDYSNFPKDDGFVVPLECIVRFGITSASSIYRKYAKLDPAARQAFEQELGATKPLQVWQYLERPISDFTTKFESKDRMLSRQEAFVTSSLCGDQFARCTRMAVLGAWAVRHLLAGLGLSMWDIKWEFAKNGDELVFVDTIDTDSLRATLELEFEGRRFLNHYNKQAMRDYFNLLHTDWINAINESKTLGDASGTAFTEILKAGQANGTYPETPQVLAEFIEIQRDKMATICNYLLGKVDGESACSSLRTTGLEELTFYQKAGKLEALFSINGIS